MPVVTDVRGDPSSNPPGESAVSSILDSNPPGESSCFLLASKDSVLCEDSMDDEVLGQENQQAAGKPVLLFAIYSSILNKLNKNKFV
jgi:hypothetical protein